MDDFLSPQEKTKLQKVLTKSSQLQNSSDRRSFLDFCSLGKYNNSLNLEKPTDQFITEILAKLSEDYVTIENKKELALIIFLKCLIGLDSGLSEDDKKFIEYVINKAEQSEINPDDPPSITTVSEESTAKIEPIAYNEKTWVGRETLLQELPEQLKEGCHLLLITGITGQGKTAFAERLALVELAQDWQYLPPINFDDGSIPQDFAGVARILLTNMGEAVTQEETKNPSMMLNRLMAKLRTHRYLIEIDSLERILEGKNKEGIAENQFQDQWWETFFNSVLAKSQSLVMVTTQDTPTNFDRYEDFLREIRLGGLEENDYLPLFNKIFSISPLFKGGEGGDQLHCC